MRSIASWYEKANAMHEAWRARFNEEPPLHALVMVLAHGQFETELGDSWPGEHNVGAVQERILDAKEKAAIRDAGITPSVANVQPAKAALAAAGLRSAGLHCDTSPDHGPYFVYFRVFDNDTEGDKYFLGVVAKHHALLSDPTTTEHAYAAALYGTQYGYYEGRYKRAGVYELREGHWVLIDPLSEPKGPRKTGPELNIADYAVALSSRTKTIAAALVDWYPGKTILAPQRYDLSTWLGRQQALNRFGSVPQLAEDGLLGTKTVTSLAYFQVSAGLVPTGRWDDETEAKMAECLTRLIDEPTDPEMHA